MHDWRKNTIYHLCETISDSTEKCYSFVKTYFSIQMSISLKNVPTLNFIRNKKYKAYSNFVLLEFKINDSKFSLETVWFDERYKWTNFNNSVWFEINNWYYKSQKTNVNKNNSFPHGLVNLFDKFYHAFSNSNRIWKIDSYDRYLIKDCKLQKLSKIPCHSRDTYDTIKLKMVNVGNSIGKNVAKLRCNCSTNIYQTKWKNKVQYEHFNKLIKICKQTNNTTSSVKLWKLKHILQKQLYDGKMYKNWLYTTTISLEESIY